VELDTNNTCQKLIINVSYNYFIYSGSSHFKDFKFPSITRTGNKKFQTKNEQKENKMATFVRTFAQFK